jgi:pimeloyl-ACP methyl ester carboxylesterase
MTGRILVLGAFCGFLCSCVVLSKKDAFPVAGKPLNIASLQALTDRRGEVQRLEVSADGHPVAAYYVRHPDARGVLIFFGGSGNQVGAAVKVLGTRTEAIGLDLVVFSYYQEGEEIPSVTEARAKTKALYAAVKARNDRASKSIYLLGHSSGGWFALEIAATENVSGLALAGAETTPAEVIRKTYSPLASLVIIRPDEDAKQLDAALYAPHVHSRTLVVTSRQDEAVPVAVAQKLFGLLPAAEPKHLVVLDGVSHGRYFLSEEFWRQFADFFKLHQTG